MYSWLESPDNETSFDGIKVHRTVIGRRQTHLYKHVYLASDIKAEVAAAPLPSLFMNHTPNDKHALINRANYFI